MLFDTITRGTLNFDRLSGAGRTATPFHEILIQEGITGLNAWPLELSGRSDYQLVTTQTPNTSFPAILGTNPAEFMVGLWRHTYQEGGANEIYGLQSRITEDSKGFEPKPVQTFLVKNEQGASSQISLSIGAMPYPLDGKANIEGNLLTDGVETAVRTLRKWPLGVTDPKLQGAIYLAPIFEPDYQPAYFASLSDGRAVIVELSQVEGFHKTYWIRILKANGEEEQAYEVRKSANRDLFGSVTVKADDLKIYFYTSLEFAGKPGSFSVTKNGQDLNARLMNPDDAPKTKSVSG